MEPIKKKQYYRVFATTQGADHNEDEGDNSSSLTSATDASDLSYDWDGIDDGEVNLDSLVPLNSASMMEAAIAEEGTSEFLQTAPEQIADVESEFLDGLLVSDSVMQVTAVETRTCWPLEVVQSSSAMVLLRANPGRKRTAQLVDSGAAAASTSASAQEFIPGTIEEVQPISGYQSEATTATMADLMSLLTQPKLVPHNPDMHTVQLRPKPPVAPPNGLQRLAYAAMTASGLYFRAADLPPMSRCEKVPYLHGFSLGDTYQLQAKLWLLPQLLCGALALTGMLLTLVGIIMLQINKYLVSLCVTPGEGLQCRTDEETITSVTMSIGVGTAGGGLCLIMICGIVFLHAFCIIYDEGEHHKTKNQENVSLHVPTAAYRINMHDLSNALDIGLQNQQVQQQQPQKSKPRQQPQQQPQQQQLQQLQQPQQQQPQQLQQSQQQQPQQLQQSQQQQPQQLQQSQQQQPQQLQQQKMTDSGGWVRCQSYYDNLHVTDNI